MISKSVLGSFYCVGGQQQVGCLNWHFDTLVMSDNKKTHIDIPFPEFRPVIYNVQHSFLSIPVGSGLMSQFYCIMGKAQPVVFMYQNAKLWTAIQECCTFLPESVSSSTKCNRQIGRWPHIVGVTDASKHGVGGVIIEERWSLPPTVFHFAWLEEVKHDIVLAHSPQSSITNSDLELAAQGLLFLENLEVAGDLQDKHVMYYRDSSPSISWVQWMAVKSSPVAMQPARAPMPPDDKGIPCHNTAHCQREQHND